MVVSRKLKESFLAKNLILLRKQNGNTLEEMAEFLNLSSKSSYKAYEEDRALPDIHKLMKLASYFDVAVADLMYQDLEIFSNKPDARKLFNVIKIPVAAAAGYAKGFGDPEYMSQFETIKIPFEPYGFARAFDIQGDSMQPEIEDGATVVGIKINKSELKDNKSYIIVTVDGIQCKKVRFEEQDNFIYLISTNSKYLPKHIIKEDVLEMWEVWKTI